MVGDAAIDLTGSEIETEADWDVEASGRAGAATSEGRERWQAEGVGEASVSGCGADGAGVVSPGRPESGLAGAPVGGENASCARALGGSGARPPSSPRDSPPGGGGGEIPGLPPVPTPASLPRLLRWQRDALVDLLEEDGVAVLGEGLGEHALAAALAVAYAARARRERALGRALSPLLVLGAPPPLRASIQYEADRLQAELFKSWQESQTGDRNGTASGSGSGKSKGEGSESEVERKDDQERGGLGAALHDAAPAAASSCRKNALHDAAPVASPFSPPPPRPPPPPPSSSPALPPQLAVAPVRFLSIPAITAEVSGPERSRLYASSSVVFVTARILVVDFLTGRLPPSRPGALLIARAHRAARAGSREAFAVRLFRGARPTGSVWALSEAPRAFAPGFGGLERALRSLRVRGVFLWPRFADAVRQDLEAKVTLSREEEEEERKGEGKENHGDALAGDADADADDAKVEGLLDAERRKGQGRGENPPNRARPVPRPLSSSSSSSSTSSPIDVDAIEAEEIPLALDPAGRVAADALATIAAGVATDLGRAHPGIFDRAPDQTERNQAQNAQSSVDAATKLAGADAGAGEANGKRGGVVDGASGKDAARCASRGSDGIRNDGDVSTFPFSERFTPSPPPADCARASTSADPPRPPSSSSSLLCSARPDADSRASSSWEAPAPLGAGSSAANAHVAAAYDAASSSARSSAASALPASVPSSLLASADSTARRALGRVWHALGARTRQMVDDLKTLRELSAALTRTDPVSFLERLEACRAAEASRSVWMLHREADVVFEAARSRVYRIVQVGKAAAGRGAGTPAPRGRAPRGGARGGAKGAGRGGRGRGADATPDPAKGWGGGSGGPGSGSRGPMTSDHAAFGSSAASFSPPSPSASSLASLPTASRTLAVPELAVPPKWSAVLELLAELATVHGVPPCRVAVACRDALTAHQLRRACFFESPEPVLEEIWEEYLERRAGARARQGAPKVRLGGDAVSGASPPPSHGAWPLPLGRAFGAQPGIGRGTAPIRDSLDFHVEDAALRAAAAQVRAQRKRDEEQRRARALGPSDDEGAGGPGLAKRRRVGADADTASSFGSRGRDVVCIDDDDADEEGEGEGEGGEKGGRTDRGGGRGGIGASRKRGRGDSHREKSSGEPPRRETPTNTANDASKNVPKSASPPPFQKGSAASPSSPSASSSSSSSSSSGSLFASAYSSLPRFLLLEEHDDAALWRADPLAVIVVEPDVAFSRQLELFAAQRRLSWETARDRASNADFTKQSPHAEAAVSPRPPSDAEAAVSPRPPSDAEAAVSPRPPTDAEAAAPSARPSASNAVFPSSSLPPPSPALPAPFVPLRVFVLCYERSSETERYAHAVRAERAAFARLIKAKEILTLPGGGALPGGALTEDGRELGGGVARGLMGGVVGGAGAGAVRDAPSARALASGARWGARGEGGAGAALGRLLGASGASSALAGMPRNALRSVLGGNAGGGDGDGPDTDGGGGLRTQSAPFATTAAAFGDSTAFAPVGGDVPGSSGNATHGGSLSHLQNAATAVGGGSRLDAERAARELAGGVGRVGSGAGRTKGSARPPSSAALVPSAPSSRRGTPLSVSYRPRPVSRPLVVVDVREFNAALPGALHARGMDVAPVTLEVGDYVLAPDAAVERKSLPDLRASLASGRLAAQAAALVRHYETAILLIEFDDDAAFSLAVQSGSGGGGGGSGGGSAAGAGATEFARAHAQRQMLMQRLQGSVGKGKAGPAEHAAHGLGKAFSAGASTFPSYFRPASPSPQTQAPDAAAAALQGKLCQMAIAFPRLRFLWSPSVRFSAEALLALKEAREEPNPVVAAGVGLPFEAEGGFLVDQATMRAADEETGKSGGTHNGHEAARSTDQGATPGAPLGASPPSYLSAKPPASSPAALAEAVVNRPALDLLRRLPGVSDSNIRKIAREAGSLTQLSLKTEQELVELTGGVLAGKRLHAFLHQDAAPLLRAAS